MKSKRNCKIWISFSLEILIVFSIISISNLNLIVGSNYISMISLNDNYKIDDNLRLSKISGPISITGNSGWVSAKGLGICTGNGTYSEPYIIEDYVIVSGGMGAGIWISSSNVYFKIENCTISNYNDGIYLYYTNNGTLVNNNCSNDFYGLHTAFSDNNTISGNIASNNLNSGIFLDNSTNHIVSGNNCSRNVEIGLYIQKSSNNTISENYVIDNGWENAWDDTAKNQWDSGIIGNYWSDYSGKDTNDNGIGDTPYPIPGTEIAKDNYPIWWDPPIISIISPLENETFGSNAPEYTLSIEGVPNTMWYIIEGITENFPIINLTGTIDQDAWNNLTEGDIIVTFYVQDNRGETDSESIIVIKKIPSRISGYSLFFLFGITSIIIIIIARKKMKS